MKHQQLLLAIGDAVTDEMKPLLAPLIAAELARQRTGGDPNAPPTLPALTRAADRFRLRAVVQWAASTQLKLMCDLTESIASAISERVTKLVRDALIAEKIADGTAQREFDALVAESKRIPAERAAARAKIAHVKNLPLCLEEAKAREALAGLIASMRAKRERRAERGRAA